ncbi:MAG: hypothetical protein ABIN18_05645 [Pseudomonadota bacterium]
MSDVDVKAMTKEQLIKIVKDQGNKIETLEAKVQSATDFIEGVKAGQAKPVNDDDGDDW